MGLEQGAGLGFRAGPERRTQLSLGAVWGGAQAGCGAGPECGLSGAGARAGRGPGTVKGGAGVRGGANRQSLALCCGGFVQTFPMHLSTLIQQHLSKPLIHLRSPTHLFLSNVFVSYMDVALSIDT